MRRARGADFAVVAAIDADRHHALAAPRRVAPRADRSHPADEFVSEHYRSAYPLVPLIAAPGVHITATQSAGFDVDLYFAATGERLLVLGHRGGPFIPAGLDQGFAYRVRHRSFVPHLRSVFLAAVG